MRTPSLIAAQASGEEMAPWRLELGANLLDEGRGVRFRVWAPEARAVELLLDGAEQATAMHRAGDGTWGVDAPDAAPGSRYTYRLDSSPSGYPDPYSRSQPDGVHGPSLVVDPHAYRWHDRGWPGVDARGLVIYECHVGTMTPLGSFAGLVGQLDRVRELGVNAIELMPVAEFPGRWNWGYDGVNLFAPSSVYGGPDGLKRLVDAAHARGLAVLLDVVYNHLGPDGNYLGMFSRSYFTSRHQTPWGDAVNYDQPPGCGRVRGMVLDNALYWIDEFHLDGLRLDAIHTIKDTSERHILADLSSEVRALAARRGRSVVLIGETEENDVAYLVPIDQGGRGLDAVWADDLHHALRRYLVGDQEGYYADYEGTLAEVARAIEQGWLYEGQLSNVTGSPRGTPARDRPAHQFVVQLQNHDQVGNRPFGDRLHHQLDPDRYRAASALLLTLPYTPLLFQGQEFAASSPFLYFTDHNPELGRLVTEGRRREFAAFNAFSDPHIREQIPDPQAEDSFTRSIVDVAEAERPPGAHIQRLYQELLALRSTDPVLRQQERRGLAAWAPSRDVLVVAQGEPHQRRLTLCNFGDEPVDLDLSPDVVPVSPRVLLSTTEDRFGGSGTAIELRAGAAARVPARSAVILGTGLGRPR